jgi:hypothetical protein
MFPFIFEDSDEWPIHLGSVLPARGFRAECPVQGWLASPGPGLKPGPMLRKRPDAEARKPAGWRLGQAG